MSRVWSPLQKNIFDFVESGQGNAIISAVAGSGKTTTIVEAVKRAKGQTLFLAFNKAIADELKGRGVNARTFHSICWSSVLNALKISQPTIDKLRQINKSYMTKGDLFMYGYFVEKLVSLGRQIGIDCLVPDSVDQWRSIISHHDMSLENDRANISRAIELARITLSKSNSSKMVDFDDMLYLTVRNKISLPKFDFVFVDEAQDTNSIQREILRKLMKPSSRLVAVGDASQAIYGFRGSDSDSMKNIKDEWNAIELPLSITYRCPKSVVEYAKTWVDEIVAHDAAEEGEVVELGDTWDHTTFNCNDMVICRRTAPLVDTAFSLIKSGVPARVLGKDIGIGLKALVKRMQPTSLTNLEVNLKRHLEKETMKFNELDEPEKIAALRDRVESLFAIIASMKDTATVQDLNEVIDRLFSESSNCVILCTIHKAKGLEADRVFWLDRSGCPSKWARKDWMRVQEDNLCYVATTRAKKSLFLLEIKK